MRTFKLTLESIVNNSYVTYTASIPCCQKLEFYSGNFVCMDTVFFSKAATEITLAGLKQPFCFCSLVVLV